MRTVYANALLSDGKILFWYTGDESFDRNALSTNIILSTHLDQFSCPGRDLTYSR